MSKDAAMLALNVYALKRSACDMKGALASLYAGCPLMRGRTLVDEPLALCDGRTLNATSLVICTHIDHEGQETYNQYGMHDASMRWHYLRHQTRDVLFRW